MAAPQSKRWMMSCSSGWIDDILSPSRVQARETHEKLRTVIMDTARGCKDNGATEAEAFFFTMGLYYASMPNMTSLFQMWVREVYGD